VVRVRLRFGPFGGIEDGLGELVSEFAHGECLSRPSSADGGYTAFAVHVAWVEDAGCG
jgi:hypothetical protein